MRISMSRDDAELGMPSNLRGDDSTRPFLSDTTAGGALQPNEPSRKGMLRLTVDVPLSSSKQRNSQARSLPRWRTPEFYFYYVVFAVAVPAMVWTPIRLSSPSHPNYDLYSGRLEDGWIPGREIDNSDAQFQSFRNNVPVLALIAIAFFASKYIYLQLAPFFRATSSGTRLHLIPFVFVFSLAFIFGLHGASLLKILFILSVNYGIAKIGRESLVTPPLTWLFNMAILFAIERNEGYRFASLSQSLSFLDRYQGEYHRWFIPFNFTMLRLVSFNMDYHWACLAIAARKVPDSSEKEMNHKQRTNTPHDLESYNFVNFVAYALYPPLYIAGPIMTFNDFMWQHLRPPTHSWKTVARYALRFVICMLTMEVILHFMYVVAIKDMAAWRGDTPLELCMISFWNLTIVWLKLLLPWRFFRLWALADGLDPQENMVRCMANNYSTLGFWKAWHRSFNLWIVRYIYIPLGGTKNRLVTTALVFTFVALWHDLTFRLLAWGWLVSLFIVPEVTARYLLPSAKYRNRPWYRHVCAVGGVGNILMMFMANLVGFVTGVEGVKYMVEQIFGTFGGIRFLVVACGCLFVGVQVMFEYREEEERNGIFRGC